MMSLGVDLFEFILFGVCVASEISVDVFSPNWRIFHLVFLQMPSIFLFLFCVSSLPPEFWQHECLVFCTGPWGSVQLVSPFRFFSLLFRLAPQVH